jgi:hypothetical protein
MGGRLRQEDPEFQASLGYGEIMSQKKRKAKILKTEHVTKLRNRNCLM